MSNRDRSGDSSLRCSFCQKAQGAARKLISTASRYPRAYICSECVAVCHYIIEDDKAEPGQVQDHPLLKHPLAPVLMAAIENWVRDEAAGADVRRIATQMISESRA